jgi:L-amino acid N-acyltransferase YncA
MAEQVSPVLTIRDASEADAAACAAIYRPFVLDTAVSFELVPPTAADMAARIREASSAHAWLVAEVAGADAEVTGADAVMVGANAVVAGRAADAVGGMSIAGGGMTAVGGGMTAVGGGMAAAGSGMAAVGGAVVGYAYARPFAAREAYRWSCETSIYLPAGRRRAGVGRTLYRALLARLTERGFRVVVAKMTLPNPASEGLHAALGFRPVGVHRRIGYKNGAWHDVAISQLDLVTDDGPPAEPR